ncbi:MAG: hypothetical protein CVU57_12015 [Deltaproteobacteria bacterium HGW-Deltaproteobacteria-15]|jgi:hypothetical protein|nr:MAG: hypothetical protein CVU57_12015 [Deltaproteobacteria bacterium HGW-Deltaproteobacteria-15]
MEEIGKLIVSFDVELGWGAIENGTWQQKESGGIYRETRPAVSGLLSMLEEMEMPATWCFVGRLLEHESIECGQLPDGVAQACTIRGEETTWRGFDLLDMIVASRMAQEVGCHSFFHCRCHADFMTEELFREDLANSVRIFNRMALKPKSFVFPSNEERWTSILPEYGFTSFRGNNSRERISVSNGAVRKVISLLRMGGALPIRTELPSQEGEELWRLPGTVLFNTPVKRRRFLPGLVKRVKRGLNSCITSHGYFHIWSHPYNFAQNPNLLAGLREILAFAAEMRDAGRLDIVTMQGFVKDRTIEQIKHPV